MPLDIAMSCDVNGFLVGHVLMLSTMQAFRYLSTNINTHHGGYPFNKPLTAFLLADAEGQQDFGLERAGLPPGEHHGPDRRREPGRRSAGAGVDVGQGQTPG